MSERLQSHESEQEAVSRLFKSMSDELWEGHDGPLSFETAPLVPVDDAFTKLSETLHDIDPKLVLAGPLAAGDTTTMSPWGEEVTLEQGEAIPRSATAVTFNHDALCGDASGWFRQLGVHFTFGMKNGHMLRVSHELERSHSSDQAFLAASIWYSDFAETGYEGKQEWAGNLSYGDEMKLLNVLQEVITSSQKY